MPKRRLFRAGAIGLAIFSASCSRIPRQAATPSPPGRELHEDNPFEAAEYFREQRVLGDGLLPIERYRAALDHAAAMRHYSLREGRFAGDAGRDAATFGAWESLGPGNIGGRTRGLVVSPQNSSIMWAGGATGGLWKTADGGNSWTPVDDFAPVLAINCLVMAPNDANTLYACTGEQTQNWRGAGIYRSTDGGNTWAQLPATNTADFYFVNSLAISPASPSHLYAATNTGLWTSLDGGATWNLSLVSRFGGPAATLTGGTTNGCFDAILEPGQSTDTVLAVCHQPSSLQYSVFRNPDAAGAGTWTVVLSDPNMWYVALAAAPSQPATIYSAAVTSTTSTTDPYYRALLAVYRSTDGGATWTTQTSQGSGKLNSAILSIDSAYDFAEGAGSSYCNANASSIDFNGQAGYNLAIAVDPLNPNSVWAAGIGIFRSDDGAVTWGFAGGGTHPDQHGLVFDPGFDGNANQTLYSISDGGVYKTTVARARTGTCASTTTAVNWTSLDNGYITTQFYHGVPYPGGGAFFGGTQDNGTLRGTSGAAPWSSIVGGDGGVSRLDPLNASTVYAEYVHGTLYKSTDGGYTFSNAYTGITESSGNFPFIAWYVFDPNDTQRLYTGGAQMWRTENAMGSWTAESAPIPAVSGNLDNIRSIAVSPFDSNTVVFGTFSGKIYWTNQALSSNGNSSWSYSTPRAGNVASLEFDPNQRNVVYATYSTFDSAPSDNHIYRSTDGGQSWTGIDGTGSNGLPDVPVETLLVDPLDSNRIYLGTDTGVFASLDGGNTWVKDTDPFANAIVMNLAIDSAEGSRSLYAFTYGRGVWRVPLPSGGGASVCSYAVSPSNIAADPTGGVYAAQVTAGANCGWTAVPSGPATGNALRAAVEPPGSGAGNGSAYLSVAPNASTSPRRSSYLVATQTVTVTQAAAVPATNVGDEISSAGAVASLPYEGYLASLNFTRNAADPVQSCTGSAGYQTSWVAFTAPATGNAQATIESSGPSGARLAVTAYPLSGQTLGAEMGCAALSADTAAPPQTVAAIAFAVTGGARYILEFSTQAASTNASLYFGISMAPATPLLDVSPPEAIVQPGGTQLFQPVGVNLGNAAVRWQIAPQAGVITLAGEYLAPTGISAPTQVTLTAQSLGNPNLMATSTVTVQPAPPVTLGPTTLKNAASAQTGAVAPGEVVAIFGTAIGPASPEVAQLNAQGRLASQLSGTQVLFDNIPAPLAYVSANQVNAIVPYEVAGQATTQMSVITNGQATAPLTLNVTALSPALFTANMSGTGQAAAVNQDTTLNGPGSGAPAGSILSLYGTGEGQTTPGGINGRLAIALLPRPLASVSVTIGNVDAPVQFAGAAAEETAGLLQVNVLVPQLAPGSYPVVLTVGGQASAPGVTVTVR